MNNIKKHLLRFKNQLTPSYETRKLILGRVQVAGLHTIGAILRGLTFVLFGSNSRWRGFTSVSTSSWILESTRYSLSRPTIEGVDKALRENLPPGVALDRLARKAGIPKSTIEEANHSIKAAQEQS